MKRILLVWIILSLGFCYGQEDKKVDSKVISATVFKDRAMVTRQAKLDLPKGKHKIIFSNLTTDLQDESVRVSANGPGVIKILDMKVERGFTTEIQQEKVRRLQLKIDSLNLHLQMASDQIAIYDSKKEFVEALKAQSIKYINQKMLMTTSSPKNWSEMLRFVDKNLSKIYDGLRKQRYKKQIIEQQIKTIKMTINQSKGRKSRSYKEIIVKIETTKKGKINLNPSYLVQNANWYPLYDARASSASKEIEFSYFGMIQQSTGEDWENVNLTLSTADPLSVKSLPKLDRWFLDIKPLPFERDKYKVKRKKGSTFQVDYDQNWGIPRGKGSVTGYITNKSSGNILPGVNIVLEGTLLGSATDMDGKFFIANVPAGHYTVNISYVGYQTLKIKLEVIEKHTANILIPLSESTIETGEAIVVMAERPVVQKDMTSSIKIIDRAGHKDKIIKKPKYTNVYAKELSTVFELPTKNSIPSDNSPHKVTIAIDVLPIEFEYTSIPKVLPKVYLKGKVINKNNYPMLEGEINVFVDNDFINRTYLNTIVPTDTLELALGIDERIRTEKILINKFMESKGILGGTKQITYEYEIQAINNRETEEVIWIYDQLPIPMNEKIKIELLIPEKDKNKLKNDQQLVWRLKLKPGEKKILPIKFQVQFPENQNVYGLE